MKHQKTKLATAIATLLGAQAQGEETQQILPEIIATRAHRSTFVDVAFGTGADGVAPSADAGVGPGEELTKRRFRIPAGALSAALSQFATAAGARLSFDPALTEGKTTRGLMGDFTREEGLAVLLAGTGLEWAPGPGGTYAVRPTARAQATPEAPQPTGEQPVELAPIIVTAQPLDQGFKADMQETATKTPLLIRETPQSISVITRHALEARQVLDIGQALQTAAGVNQFSGVGPFAGRGSFGLGQTQIRGIGSNFFTDRDEGFLSPIFAARPDLAPYEPIEVLKGPSATLYGRSSAGGFVNCVRKKPLPEFESELEVSVGSFDFYRAEGDVTGPLFKSEHTRGRLVLAYENAGAFVDGVESEVVVVAPSLDFDLTDSTRLLLQGTYQRDDLLPNPGFPLVRDGDISHAPNVRRSLYFGVPNEDEENTEIRVGIAQLEQELGDDWLATLRLNRTATRQRAGAENYAYGITPDGDTSLYASRLNQDNDVWSGELRLNGRVEVLGRPANVTLGVDHINFEFVSDQEFPSLGTANIYAENFTDVSTQPTTPSFDGLSVEEGTGVYAQFQFRPFERLSVLLGGRYDWADTSFDNRLDSDSKGEKRDEDFTGRVGLTFDLSEQVAVYGLYAQSFDPVLDPGADGEVLEPETGEILEAGIKTEWLDGKLDITAAVFRLDRENIPIDAMTPPGAPLLDLQRLAALGRLRGRGER